MKRTAFLFLLSAYSIFAGSLRDDAVTTMRRAAGFYREKVASHGGYVYYYSLDLKERHGEGECTVDQIWVEPPGTPTVGMAYLKAYESTGDKFYLDAALETGEALIYGQLKSGGWTHCIDFNPKGGRVAQYRNGRGGGKNYSTFDDNKTQSALRMLMRLDKALEFKNARVSEAVRFAQKSVLSSQFSNGGFPQGWLAPVEDQPVVKAAYPDYEWRTEGRIKNYWDYYTLNDNLAGDTTLMLHEAYDIYGDERFLKALRKLGNFLVLAQMPDPQPAWAQQYNYEMNPMWARRFEPPAITGSESQDVMNALMDIYCITGDAKYLKPVPRAVKYFRSSLLPDGRLARYYELKTNRPLYMFRKGKVYTLTYDDSRTPSHYAWKVNSRLDKLESRYKKLVKDGAPPKEPSPGAVSEKKVRQIIKDLDSEGRWISSHDGRRLSGQPKFKEDHRYISSRVFSRNIEALSTYIHAAK